MFGLVILYITPSSKTFRPSSTSYDDAAMDQSIPSPTSQELVQVDMNALARATLKTFERLAPFSQLQTSTPSIEVTQIVTKIIKKVSAYIQAIDSSILALQIVHQLSSDAVALCNLAVGQDDQDLSFTLISTESERRRRLDGLLMQAENAYEKALKAQETFREVEQDLYKIAASTKDNNSIIHIPVDPARPTTIQRPLKDLAFDLVANLGVLTEFFVHTSHLAGCCGAIKADLAAGGLSSTVTQAVDETDSLVHVQSIRARWIAFKKNTLEYHKVVKDLQTRYSDLLPASTIYWTLANEGNTSQKPRKARNVRTFTVKASNIFRDCVLHLAHHASIPGV